MRAKLLVLLSLLLASCSPPVMFRVDVDEPIAEGNLILNGRSAKLMKNLDGAFWAKWGGSDASGRIDIVFPDGGRVSCTVGYVTNGMMDIQEFAVQARICQQLINAVSG